MKTIFTILKNWKYSLSFLIISFIVFWFFIYLPVKTIPGNDFQFQLKILSFKELALLIILSLLISLSLVMQIYLWRKNKRFKNNIAHFGTSSLGGFSGVIASIFGTATCASCITALFGFLGAATIISLIQYRDYVVWGAAAFLLTSIYFTARRINKVCENCKLL